MKPVFGDWDGSVADARRVQAQLAADVVLRDDVLIRMLPFGGLWQRLSEPDRERAKRMPSRQFENWPKRRGKQEPAA